MICKNFYSIEKNIKEKLQVSPFIHPTNSSYGFGGNIYSQKVYNKIYKLKNRNTLKPFFITVKDIKSIQDIGLYDERIEYFLSKYPYKTFTFLLLRDNKLPDYINPGIETVGVQLAKGPIKKLFEVIDFPIFGTSANISGNNPLYNSQEIIDTFGHNEDIIFLDGGDLEKSNPSTIIDLSKKEYKIVRGSIE